MDRVHAYIGQSYYEWQVTYAGQATMVALAKLAGAVLGSSTLANGLSCAPTSPASLQVQIGAGEIYQSVQLEPAGMDTLPPDTTDFVLKQGINLAATLLSCPPPATPGQSINYLIEAQYQDDDISQDPTTGNNNVTLSFYNAANPSQPWSGPNNSGQSSSTIRKGIVALQAKAGAAATSGSQTTPSADAGWVGLWAVTVVYGATSITSGAIAQASGAPFISETLTAKISQSTADGRYLQIATYQSGADLYTGAAAGGPNAWTAALSPAPASLVDGMQISVDFSATNTSVGPTLNLNSLGALTIYEADGATALPIGLLPLNAILRYRSTSGGRWVLISAAPITTGVVSFNTRTGAVTLSGGDISGALGYTPLDAAGSVAATGKETFFTSTTGSASINIPPGAVPSAPVNGDIWATSSGVFARVAGSTQQLATTSGAVTSFNSRTGSVTLTAGDVTTALSAATLSGKLTFANPSSGGAGINMGQGTAPTSPVNGDFWFTTAGAFGYINGALVPFMGAGGGGATVVGDFAAWANTSGTLLQDVAAASATQIWTGSNNASPVTSLSLANAQAELVLIDGASISWNMANGLNATVTLGGNRTLATPTNPIANYNYRLKIVQPNSGGPYTLNWPTNFDWGGAGAPSLSSGANVRDVVMLEYEAASNKFIAMFWKGS